MINSANISIIETFKKAVEKTFELIKIFITSILTLINPSSSKTGAKLKAYR